MAGAFVAARYDGIREKIFDISFLDNDGVATNLDVDYSTSGMSDFSETPNYWTVTPLALGAAIGETLMIPAANVTRTGVRISVCTLVAGGAGAVNTFRVNVMVAPGYVR